MKIIQRGTPPREKEWKFKCLHCSTIFECVQSEGRLIYGLKEDGDTLQIECPVCEHPCYGSPK